MKKFTEWLKENNFKFRFITTTNKVPHHDPEHIFFDPQSRLSVEDPEHVLYPDDEEPEEEESTIITKIKPMKFGEQPTIIKKRS